MPPHGDCSRWTPLLKGCFGSRFCSLYSASLFRYPNQQLSQPVNSLHPSSYLSFHGGHLKFFSKTFTMFFLMSSVGSLNFIPFVNS